MLWPLSVVPVANTNGRLAIPALAGLLVSVAKGVRQKGVYYLRFYFVFTSVI